MSIDNTIQRLQIERDEKWKDIVREMPSLRFPKKWRVTINPPFAGAIVRFVVEYKGKYVSVYADFYDKLGIVGEPYWEIYPYEGDNYRCKLKDTNKLLDAIEHTLEN